jgi:hypothetical protein
VPVTNLGTTAAPVYGATMPYTFTNTGSYSITATYTPASYFTASTSAATAITVTTPTFVSGTTSSQLATVAPGETALYSFVLGQTVYSGSISFACSGLPAGASCVFYPSTITATGCSATNTVALSIFTTGPTVALSSFGGSGRGLWGAVSVLGGAGLALLIGLRRRRLPMRLGQLGMVLALLLASSGLVACNSNVSAPPATPISTTPYNITITATGSTGTVSSFMVSLTVQ